MTLSDEHTTVPKININGKLRWQTINASFCAVWDVEEKHPHQSGCFVVELLYRSQYFIKICLSSPLLFVIQRLSKSIRPQIFKSSSNKKFLTFKSLWAKTLFGVIDSISAPFTVASSATQKCFAFGIFETSIDCNCDIIEHNCNLRKESYEEGAFILSKFIYRKKH